jgi:hypothetical protein
VLRRIPIRAVGAEGATRKRRVVIELEGQIIDADLDRNHPEMAHELAELRERHVTLELKRDTSPLRSGVRGAGHGRSLRT